MIVLALSGVLDVISYPKAPLIGIGAAGIVLGSFRLFKKIRLKRRLAERGSLY